MQSFKVKLTCLALLIFISGVLAQIDITVRWNRPRGQVTPELLGLNVWDGYDTATSTHPDYQDNIAYMSPGLIRFHASESTRDSGQHDRGWVNYDERTWDAEKIAEILAAFESHDNMQMTISNWPSWMDPDNNGKLHKDQFPAYAQWCADLVQLVNINLGFGIPFWSTFNEAENKVEGNANGLAELYVQCATAMKAVDPSIKIGGGEWTQPWDDAGLNAFIAGAQEHLDFFTYHHYVTGDPNKTDDEIFAAANGMASRGSAIQNKLTSNGLDIPLWITENNIFWSWDLDKRKIMRSVKAAIYQALLLKHLAEAGAVDGTAIWNDSDNTYGVMSSSFDKRATTHLIMLKNNYMLGTPVSTISRKSTMVNAFAVDAPTGKVVMLINQTAADTTVNLDFVDWMPAGASMEIHSITGSGYDQQSAALDENWAQNITVAAFSIKMLRFADETAVDVQQDAAPEYFQLTAYPNPFNLQTNIRFTLEQSSYVDLDIYDITGRHIRTLLSNELTPGQLQISWNAFDQPSGTFVIQLVTDDLVDFYKVTLVK